jgi:hypothetical protein
MGADGSRRLKVLSRPAQLLTSNSKQRIQTLKTFKQTFSPADHRPARPTHNPSSHHSLLKGAETNKAEQQQRERKHEGIRRQEVVQKKELQICKPPKSSLKIIQNRRFKIFRKVRRCFLKSFMIKIIREGRGSGTGIQNFLPKGFKRGADGGEMWEGEKVLKIIYLKIIYTVSMLMYNNIYKLRSTTISQQEKARERTRRRVMKK